jgi:hypothetical protein
LARHFARAGHQVDVADSLRLPIAKGSRAVSESHVVGEPKQQTERFIGDLSAVVAKRGIDLVVPTCEEIFYVARFQDQIGAPVFCDDFAKLEAVHNKYTFTKLAENCGIFVPETHLLTSNADLLSFLDDSLAWVFKPVYSRFAAFTKVGVSAAALADVLPSEKRPWVAQRRIFGRELCSYAVTRHGNLRALAAYHPLYRLDKSSGIYFEPVRDAALQEFHQRFAAKHRFHGQIGFDFIETERGELYVIECNPRATSGAHLFAPADQLARAFIEDDGELICASSGPKMLSPVMLSYALPRAGRQRGFRQFYRDFRRASEAGHASDDVKPSYFQLLSLMEILARAFGRKITPMQAATADLEWDGHAL